jgi:hypothetical protein
VLAQGATVRIKRAADAAVEVVRRAEPIVHDGSRIDVNYTLEARDLATGELHTAAETHAMRHFSLPELDWLARDGGFERVAAAELISGKDPGEDTWGVCVVMRKH